MSLFSRPAGVSDTTYYKWLKMYAGLYKAVIYISQKLNTSELRTYKKVCLARSSQRYSKIKKQNDDYELMMRLAKQYVRNGYRKIGQRLRIERRVVLKR